MLKLGRILSWLLSVATFIALGYFWSIAGWSWRVVIFGIGVVAVMSYRQLRIKGENRLRVGEVGTVVGFNQPWNELVVYREHWEWLRWEWMVQYLGIPVREGGHAHIHLGPNGCSYIRRIGEKGGYMLYRTLSDPPLSYLPHHTPK